mgnify:FL=1
MKKTLLALSLFATTAFAEPVIGVGEHAFGPNTPEALACTIAEERAKEAAILKKVGEIVEIVEYQSCDDQHCEHTKDFVNNVTGIIKSIISSKIETIMQEGMETCVVTIKAEVEPVKNEIAFLIYNKDYIFKEDEEITFTGMVSHSGKVIIMNQDRGIYTKVYETKVEHPGYEFQMPDDGYKIVAKLPEDSNISNERLMFIFLGLDISVKDEYNHNELQRLLESVPVYKKRVIYQLTQIVR